MNHGEEDSKVNIKQFPRIFSLSDEKMILTRKTISKTIVLERISSGYTYDKTIWFKPEEKVANKELTLSYLNNHLKDGQPICYSSNGYQTHLIVHRLML